MIWQDWYALIPVALALSFSFGIFVGIVIENERLKATEGK